MRPGLEFVISILAAFANAWTLAANTVIAKRPWSLFAIDAAHGLAGQMIMAAIVAAWR